MQASKLDLAPLRDTFNAACPDPLVRALVLFRWLGASDGPWHTAPNYESVPELLLLEHPTSVLVEALTTTELTLEHLHGASRYFASWRFYQRKFADLYEFPPELKQTLLAHCHAAGYDRGKLGNAIRAYSW
jgi:hypothetical protein